MAAAPAAIPTPPVGLPLPLDTPPTPSAVPPPTLSQPNASSDSPPPASGSPNSSTSPPPPIPSAPPPSVSPSPPAPPANASAPVSPPVVTPPPPAILSPPPVSAPPPPLLSPPIPAPPPAPITTLSPPPPPSLSPPPAESPPILSPPPSQPPPQPVSTPPASPPPPNAISSPPPVVSPPPPSATPPEKSPPPPSAIPPENSPPPPVLRPAAPSGSPPPLSNSPPNQSSSAPESQPLPPPPPRNSSTPGIPATSPLLSPPVRSGNADSPVSPSTRNSSNMSPNNGSGSGSLPNSTGSGKNRMGATLGIGAGAVLVVFIIGLVVWFIVKKSRKRSKFGGYVIPTPLSTSQRSDISYSKPLSSAPLIGNISRGSGYPYSPPEPGALGNSRSIFMYEELLQVTNGFSEHNLLGEGGFGCVYKGCLPDGREVAVKQLNVGGSQGEREFQAEVEIISRIHHRHLVSLVGYCISEHQRLLVYDYVPNNTLYYHLHGEGRPILDWATRLKIAAGAARGIAYLHEDCHPRIIHRDIKSSNILLDNNFEAQVSDFGLARLALDSFTHVTTRVMGTFGYLAPEYASSGKLTEKSDVFSFGVVLLELITGRKPVDGSQPLGDESLVEWARPLLGHALDNREYDELIDPKLGKNYVEREMFRVIEAAAACVRHSAAKRPRMGQVVRALDSIYDSTDLSNGIRPGESKQYDSAQLSAEIREFRRMAFGTGSQDFSAEFSQTSWRTEREW